MNHPGPVADQPAPARDPQPHPPHRPSRQRPARHRSACLPTGGARAFALPCAIAVLACGLPVDGRDHRLPAATREQPADATTDFPVLATTAEVRALTPEQADQERPVDLEATVIFIDPSGTVFLEDGDAATFVRNLPDVTSFTPGQRLRVQGHSFPGLFVPGIRGQQTTVLGRPGRPAATPVDLPTLRSGRLHYHWVTVTGVVRLVEPVTESQTSLELGTPAGLLQLLVNQSPPSAADLVNAVVRVEGLAAGSINNRRQLIESRLWMDSFDDLHLLEPPPSPEAVPLTLIERLQRYTADDFIRQTRVSGVLLHRQEGGVIFLRDATGAVRVETSQPVDHLQRGQWVEAIGFPHMGRFTPWLAHGRVRAVDAGPDDVDEPAAEAFSIGLGQLLDGNYDNELVRLDATLTEQPRSEGPMLSARFETGEGELTVRLPTELADDSGGGLTQWRAGSVWNLTGIAQVTGTRSSSGFQIHPAAIELLVRDQADAVLLHPGPWWTAGRLAIASGLLAALMILSLLWAAVLRRQVSRQTRQIRQRIERQSALEERQRIAREFHDSLEQELAGLALRLDAAHARGLDGRGRALLDDARQLAHRIQTGARDFVWDLRDQPLAMTPDGWLSDLAGWLEQTAAASGLSVRLERPAKLPALSARHWHHLVRMLREGVINALKHAQATTIQVRLQVNGDHLLCRVEDDGRGFAPEQARAARAAGHFGLAGMEERAARIGAELDIVTAAGKGSLISIRLPLKVNDSGDRPQPRSSLPAQASPEPAPATGG